MPRGLPALVLALLLLPTAGAFSSAQQPLTIAYAATGAPTMVTAGALFLDGNVSDGLLVAGSTGTSLDRVPDLVIIDRARGPDAGASQRGATVELLSGSLLWTFPAGSAAQLATSERYAVALALPQAPFPTEAARPPAGFVLASEEVNGTLAWTTGEVMLVPLNATITIRDARGQPLEGWNARRVNIGAGAESDPESLDVALAASGAFTTRIRAAILAGATGAPQGLRLVIGPAEEDRFAQTSERFVEASAGLFPSDQQSPLDIFASVSGLMNGAVIVVPAAAGGAGAPSQLLESRFGDAEFPLGALTLVRGDDLALAWSPGRMELSGEPTVALGRDGFGVDEPVRVGIFPILSLVLWAFAIAAIVLYFVRRPPKAKGPITLRMASFAFYVVVLAVVLVLWDRSFTQTFGTGVGAVVREQGVNAGTLPTIGILAVFELVPWSIAAFLFALPVRIAAGVALRYLGRGKSFKGVATAAGLVSLAVFGPIYALWCFNLVWSRVSAAMPPIGG